MPYASRARRLIAGIIDLLAASAITLLIDIPIWGYHRAMTRGRVPPGHQAVVDLIATAIGLLYYSWPHARWGQTLGKRAMNTRVVRAADGEAINYGQAASAGTYSRHSSSSPAIWPAASSHHWH